MEAWNGERTQRTYHEDGDVAGDGGVPVAVAGRLAHQHAVEDEVAEAQLDAAYKVY